MARESMAPERMRQIERMCYAALARGPERRGRMRNGLHPLAANPHSPKELTAKGHRTSSHGTRDSDIIVLSANHLVSPALPVSKPACG